MITIPFRDKDSVPKRDYSGQKFTNYRKYKPFLKTDFKNKCGYSNCVDHWFGGTTTFQIDHFLPQSKYPKLKTEYSNLIYSCSFVNRAKSNDEGNYLDPCDEDYNNHFYRNIKGEIIPVSTSDKAVYMHKKLKLYLKRYSTIWVLEQLEKSMEDIRVIIDSKDDEEANALFIKVTKKYMDYKKYLRAES